MQTNNKPKIIRNEGSSSLSRLGYEIQELPKAIELERSVLGIMIMEGMQSCEKVVDLFKDDNPFFATENRRLYELLRSMVQAEEPIEIVTVTTKCSGKSLKDWDAYALASLTMAVNSSANLESNCYIILEKFMARRFIESFSVNLRMAYNEDIFELLQRAEDDIFKLTIGRTTSDYSSVGQTTEAVVTGIVAMRDRNETITGITSGIASIDRCTGGWQKSDLIIIGAPPGLGKTALMLNLAYNAAKEGIAVGIFSLEMSEPQLIKRLLSIDSGVPLDLIGRADLTDSQLENIAVSGKRIAAMPIFIDDEGANTIADIRSKARKMKSKDGVKIIFVDYIQIVESKGQTREREVALVSSGLKRVAKALDIPVIALSQLNKDGEARESKAIENDANIFFRLDRPTYKKKEAEDDPALKNCAELEIVKFRDGAAGIIIPLNVYLYKQLFTDPSFFDHQPPDRPEPNPYKTFNNRMPFVDKDDAPF